MTPEESRAFEAAPPQDRAVLAKFAHAKAELDDAGRAESRAESDLERARERRIKAQAEYRKAADTLLNLLPDDPS